MPGIPILPKFTASLPSRSSSMKADFDSLTNFMISVRLLEAYSHSRGSAVRKMFRRRHS